MTTTNNEPTSRKRLVIRVSRHSLAIAVQDIDDMSVPLDFTPYSIKGTMSITANLREAMKTLEIFSCDYAKVMVMIDTPQLVVPLDLYKESDATLLYTHSYPDTGNAIVKDVIMGDINVAVLYSIPKDINTVISDRYPSATFFNASTPVWRYLFKRSFSGGRRKLYAYFHDQAMELFGYGQNRFKFCNTFHLDNSHDALYFILNVWKQQLMDEQKDELHIVGEVPERQWMETELKGYIKNVYHISPVTDFNRSPIAQIPSLPYDMMTYFIKGR